MLTNAVDYRMPVTRRSFLQAIGLAFACSFRPLSAGFTAIADELARLFRVCSFGTALQGGLTMFAFARLQEPPRRAIGAPGISEADFDRMRARLRDERADRSAPSIRGAASRLTFQPATIIEGTRP